MFSKERANVLSISDLKEKIEPVFNRIKDTLTEHFIYIRGQIVTNYQDDVRFFVIIFIYSNDNLSVMLE